MFDFILKQKLSYLRSQPLGLIDLVTETKIQIKLQKHIMFLRLLWYGFDFFVWHPTPPINTIFEKFVGLCIALFGS